MKVRNKKKVSKKLKSSWRKHVDISDVEAFLDDKRLEERLGTPFQERKDDELFEVDNKPDSLIRPSKLFTNKTEDLTSSLKCFKGLENTSAVQDPLIKRNTVRSKEERQHPALRRKNAERLKKGIFKRKEALELKAIFKKRLTRFEEKHKRPISAGKDLWANETAKTKITKAKDWLHENTFLHTIRNISDIKKTSTYHTGGVSTVVPSFEVPHPGVSYNPAFSDHLNLVNQIAENETKLQKKEAHLTRVTQGLFKQVTEEQNTKNWISEMSEGLPTSTDKDSKKEDSDSDSEFKAINPPVSREKKKTIKQRKRQLRLREEQLQREEVKKEKKKTMDICRIKHIMKEVVDEEHKQKKKSIKRLQKFTNKLEGARRVGKNKFEESDIQFSQISELTGSLREIVPQGNILRDKFRNMQKRSLIEVTKPQFKNKKRKVKKYRLESHRLMPIEFSATELLSKKKK